MGQIKLESVTKSFGPVEVIPPLDLTIEDGEFTVFVGPSGCGKSTLLRLIAGLEDITSGKISIDGQDATHVPPAKRGLAMVFQSYALYPHMSVRKNIAFPMKMAGVPVDEQNRRIESAAAALNLTDYLDRRPGQLSGGQRQRVTLARVILKDAPILLLDEATSALDSEVEAEIQKTLYGMMEGKTVIAIAHRLSTIAQMDRILVLDQGHIVEQGSHDVLLASGGLYAEFWARQSGGFLNTEAAE